MLRPPPTRAVWQVSAGPPNRPYTDVCLKYGVALIGPGDAGPWRPDRDDSDFEGSLVRRFAAEVQPGDTFLLRTGSSTIRAVGLVAGLYGYCSQFDEVNGWDLQHARRVRWCQLPDDYNFGQRVFGANPPCFSNVNNPQLVDYAERFVNSPPTLWQTASLPSLPDEEPPLEDVPPFLQDLIAQVNDLVGLYWDREALGDHPAEDEMVAHFVVPLLRRLGWPPERIAVKWRYVDVAVFSALPRTPDTCHLIIEAKRLGAGVEGALNQARAYLEVLGVGRDIVVTDGIRYRMYDSANDFVPVAYANLARLKRSSLHLFELMKRP